MMDHRFLTIIPLYNKEAAIERAITSVLAQTVATDLLIINDGSTDASLSIASEFKSESVIIISQENKGVSNARNKGISYAKSNNYDCILFLDADDYWETNHVEELTKTILKFPNTTVFANNYKIKKSATTFEATLFSNLETDTSRELDDFFIYNYLNSILFSSSFGFKTSVISLYNEEITHSEDIDFYLKLGLNERIAFNPSVTVIKDETAVNRSHLINLENRTYTDFDIYERFTPKHKGLKKFLDINRYALAIELIMANQKEKVQQLVSKMDRSNLTTKQQKLLKLNSWQLKLLKRIHHRLSNSGLRIRTGR